MRSNHISSQNVKVHFVKNVTANLTRTDPYYHTGARTAAMRLRLIKATFLTRVFLRTRTNHIDISALTLARRNRILSLLRLQRLTQVLISEVNIHWNREASLANMSSAMAIHEPATSNTVPLTQGMVANVNIAQKIAPVWHVKQPITMFDAACTRFMLLSCISIAFTSSRWHPQ